MKNIVFCFSGTGNSLKAAKSITRELGGGSPISMARTDAYVLTDRHDAIGFVFPLYFAGLPGIVRKFVVHLNVENNKNAYYYAIVTYGGGFADNGLSQLNELLLKTHGVKLNYGQKIKMFSNYVIKYDMEKDISKILESSEEALLKAISDIGNGKSLPVRKSNALLNAVNRNFLKKAPNMAKDYTVDGNCTGCGICAEVCPADNVALADGKPLFRAVCEQCMACIQYCPQRAINYKNKTQNRGRYTHPEIGHAELLGYRG